MSSSAASALALRRRRRRRRRAIDQKTKTKQPPPLKYSHTIVPSLTPTPTRPSTSNKPTQQQTKNPKQQTEVWSPSGGWWCDPKGWRRNTAVAATLFLAAQYALFRYSSANETRYVAPKGWVASMSYTEAGRYPRKEGEEDE